MQIKQEGRGLCTFIGCSNQADAGEEGEEKEEEEGGLKELITLVMRGFVAKSCFMSEL